MAFWGPKIEKIEKIPKKFPRMGKGMGMAPADGKGVGTPRPPPRNKTSDFFFFLGGRPRLLGSVAPALN